MKNSSFRCRRAGFSRVYLMIMCAAMAAQAIGITFLVCAIRDSPAGELAPGPLQRWRPGEISQFEQSHPPSPIVDALDSVQVTPPPLLSLSPQLVVLEDSVVKVSPSAGSAYVIGFASNGDPLFLTASHCVDPPTSSYVVHHDRPGASHERRHVQILIFDRQQDFALVKARGELRPLRALKLAPPSRISLPLRVRGGGYGGGEYLEYRVWIRDKNLWSYGDYGPLEGWRLHGAGIPGHSGSPVLSENGFVVGTYVAGNLQSGVCVTATDIRRLLLVHGYDWLLKL